MEFNKELIEKVIQDIFNDPEMTLEEKIRAISEENIKETIMERLQKKDIEMIKMLNEKIFRKYYKNTKGLERVNRLNYEELKKRFEEGIVIEGGRISSIIGKKKEINDKLRELYRVSSEENFEKEIEKSKKLINYIKTYKIFFVNTKDKIRVYEELLEIYKILFNNNFVNFKVLKDKIENL